MAIPLLAAGLSLAGGLLPGVISSLVGAKTPEEARKAVAPQYDAMVAQMIGRGMTRNEATEKADEAIQGAVAEKMQEGALPGWAEALLSVAGGIGGWVAGAKMAAKGAAKVLAKETTEKSAKESAEAAAKSADKFPNNPVKPNPDKTPDLPPEPEIMPQTAAREVPIESPLEELALPFGQRPRPRPLVYERPSDMPPLPDDILIPDGAIPIAAPLRAPFAPAMRRSRADAE